MKELNQEESIRAISIIEKRGDLQAGDKCPRDSCRGIIIEDPLILFNPKHPTEPMKVITGLVCDNTQKSKRSKYHCDFRYNPLGVSEEIENWRAEIPEEAEA